MRGTNSQAAFELFRKGVAARAMPLTFARWQESDSWFRQAIEEDTGLSFADARSKSVGYPRAWSWMAYGVAMTFFEGWQANAMADAIEYANRSVALDQYDYENHWVAAFVHLVNGDISLAQSHMDTALDLNEEDLNMSLLNEMADVLIWLGRPDDAATLLKRGRRITDWNRWSMAWSCYFKAMADTANYDAALDELSQTFWKWGQDEYENDMQLLIAAIHSRKADLADAKSESAAAASEQSLAKQAFDRFLEKRPTWTIADEERRMPFGPGAEAHAMRDHWFDTLAKLGLPP